MVKQNTLLVENAEYQTLKRGLHDWCVLYAEHLPDKSQFSVYSDAALNRFVVQADERITNEFFYYFVNYMHYPEGIQSQMRVLGYTQGNEPKELDGQLLMVYVHEKDDEYDNVMITTERGGFYKFDFGGNVTAMTYGRNYEVIPETQWKLIDNIQLESIQQQKGKQKIGYKTPEVRILLHLLILIFSLIIGYDLTEITPARFFELNFYAGLFFFVWLFMDYTLLQSKTLYLVCLALTSLFLLYGYKVITIFDNEDYVFQIMIITAMPLLLVVMQLPVRMLFKQIMKREPVVETPYPSFADFVYMMFLFFASILGAFVLARLLV